MMLTVGILLFVSQIYLLARTYFIFDFNMENQNISANLISYANRIRKYRTLDYNEKAL